MFKSELRQDLIKFRRYALRVAGGRSGMKRAIGECWSEIAQSSIYRISLELDIDFVSGVSDYFLWEIKNEQTKLTWSSYCQYYENLRRVNLLGTRRSAKSNLEEFFDSQV